MKIKYHKREERVFTHILPRSDKIRTQNSSNSRPPRQSAIQTKNISAQESHEYTALTGLKRRDITRFL